MNTEVFTQEVRFTSDFDGSLQILAGLYYEDHESTKALGFNWSGNDPVIEAAIVSSLGVDFNGEPFTDLDYPQDTNFVKEQYAIFGEVSYEVNDQFTATIGLRHFDYDLDQSYQSQGYFAGSSDPNFSFSDAGDGQNYKANLSYSPNDDVLIYAQWAEGFRLPQEFFPLPDFCVGPDGLIPGFGFAPQDSLEPDELESFEVGTKSTFMDRRVTVNASVYHIKWDNIPVSYVAPCALFSTLNGGQSTSEGIEFEVVAHLTESLITDFSVSYNDAVLEEDIPLASKGANLPGSADINARIGLQYDFAFMGNEAFIRGDYSYVGEYYNDFAETGNASGDYGEINVSAGISLEQVNVDLFVKNLTNEDEFTWVEAVLSGPAYRLRPRTIGLNVSYNF